MAASAWIKCAEGVRDLFRGVFPGIAVSGVDAIPSANIIIKERDRLFADVTLPAIVIAPMAEIERPATINQDDTGHGVGVMIVKAANRSAGAVDELQYWRDLAKETIRDNRRNNSANVHLIEIEPRQVIDPAAWASMYQVSQFVARCWVRST